MNQSEFLKLWTHEAANAPGIPVETISLLKSPVLLKPVVLQKKSA